MPDTDTTMEMVRRKIKSVGAVAVFVASDSYLRMIIPVFTNKQKANSLLFLCKEGERCVRSAFIFLGFP